MALTGNLPADIAQVGYEFPASYARVIFSRAEKQTTYIYVNWYANEAARQGEKMPVKQWEYPAPTVDLVGEVLPASYAWLKTQPEFAGWVDV